MQIKYIVSTMVFWWRENHLSFEQECEFLKSLGYGIEIWPTIKGHTDCRFAGYNWSRLKEATSGMTVALHSRNDGPTISEWTEQIECAKMLNAPIVADLRSLCVSQELGIADWVFAAEVVNTAKSHDVELCVETGLLPVILKVGEKFDYIKYCLDTGFANIDTNTSFRDYVDKLASRTTYLHLTDNYGNLDDHEPPGVRGGMPRENWDYLFETINKYDNNIIGALEMFPAMPGTMISQSTRFLFDVLKWPSRPKPLPGSDETSYRPL